MKLIHKAIIQRVPMELMRKLVHLTQANKGLQMKTVLPMIRKFLVLTENLIAI